MYNPARNKRFDSRRAKLATPPPPPACACCNDAGRGLGDTGTYCGVCGKPLPKRRPAVSAK